MLRHINQCVTAHDTVRNMGDGTVLRCRWSLEILQNTYLVHQAYKILPSPIYPGNSWRNKVIDEEAEMEGDIEELCLVTQVVSYSQRTRGSRQKVRTWEKGSQEWKNVMEAMLCERMHSERISAWVQTLSKLCFHTPSKPCPTERKKQSWQHRAEISNIWLDALAK